MKKKRIIILFIMLLFVFPKIALAAEVKCTTVNNAVEDYKDLKEEIEKLECETTEDDEILKECRKKTTEKSFLLSKLFKYNDTTNCNNASLKKIVEENKGDCSNIFGSSLKDFTNDAMGVFYLIAPFLLIIFGSLDFSKIVVMNDPKDAIELRRKFFKRLISFVLLLILPWTVNFILNFNFSNYNLDSDIYVCKGDINFKVKRWETIYVQKQNNRKGGGSGGVYGNKNIMDAAEKYHAMMESTDQDWHYYDDLKELRWNDIKTSTYNPTRATCCATFIGSVLYVSGIFTEEEMNTTNYNSPEALAAFLNKHGWEKISNYSDMVAGDIVFMSPTSYGQPGHVQLYAGNGTWYNAGSDESIKRDSPYAINDSINISRFMYAYRKP